MAFNPINSSLLSVSGSRHFPDEPMITSTGSPSSDSDSESTNSDVEDSEIDMNNQFIRYRTQGHPFVKDASTKIWMFSKMDELPDNVPL